MENVDTYEMAIAFLNEQIGPGAWCLGMLDSTDDGEWVQSYGRDEPQYWVSKPMVEWPPHIAADMKYPPTDVFIRVNIDCIGGPCLIQDRQSGECRFSTDRMIEESPITYAV